MARTEELARGCRLRDISSQDVRFCYPYGNADYLLGTVDGQVADEVAVAGYAYGRAIWRSAHTGQHALPRTGAGGADSPMQLVIKPLRHRLMRGRATPLLRHFG